MLQTIEEILGILAAVAALALLSRKVPIPYPILLVLGGLALALIPGLPRVPFNPELPLAAGFVLGAIVSPPDAIAATAIAERLHIPRRIVTVVEGESLVNDATALVALRFAIAALATGAFSLAQATVQFFFVGIGGILVGLAIGWISAR